MGSAPLTRGIRAAERLKAECHGGGLGQGSVLERWEFV
jgi:hypothetical protein